ncbi:MAG TPA: hypothetical protein VG100_11050 [Xanthobacteraceae bacterium]|jgi:hypothetical protein|nr:hypothetical protein [Xanthobacteraceae bacterium]
MRKHTLVLAAVAIVALSMAAVAGVNAQSPALGAGEAATISPEALQAQVDGASLPVTQIDQLY